MRDMAPGYVEKAPAQGKSELGGRLVSSDPSVRTIDCYDGELSTSAPSWSLNTLTYDDSASAKLEGDFGTTLKAEAGGSAAREVTVTLEDIEISQLTSLYFKPASACATREDLRRAYMTEGGRTDRVVTRALRAGKITLNASSKQSAGLTINTEEIGQGASVTGDVNLSSGLVATGVNLYFAHRPERVSTTGREQMCESGLGGGACEVGPCGFILEAAAKDDASGRWMWSGSLSCQDGKAYALGAQMSAWSGQRTDQGISYSVQVTHPRPGLFAVRVVRWVVL